MRAAAKEAGCKGIDDMDQINIGFLGYGTRALDALVEHPLFSVKYFIAPQSRLCEDVYETHAKYSHIPFYIVRNNDELASILSECSNVTCFLMNACPIILNDKTLDKMPIFNIHPGDLRYNRGHQPHMWTILLGETESRIVLHEVTPKIDDGIVIRSKVINVTDEDDGLTLLNRLEDQIPYLLDGLYDYLCKNASPEDEIHDGDYRRVLMYEDYRIDFAKAEDDNFVIETSRKIRARVPKHGAFFYFDDKMIYVNKMLTVTDIETMRDDVLVEIKGEIVWVEAGKKRFQFRLCQVVPIQGKK